MAELSGRKIYNQVKRKHDCTTWYIKNWVDSDKLQGFGSYQTFGFGGQFISPKCPTFYIPEPLWVISRT